MSINVNNLEVGRLYYVFYITGFANKLTPIVETWEYLGFSKCNSTSPDHEVPYFGYHFRLFSESRIEAYPNKKMVEDTFFDWVGVLTEINDPRNSIEELSRYNNGS